RHVSSDMSLWFSMRRALLEHGFFAYSHLQYPYPYPPLFMPWLMVSVWIGDRLGIPRDVALKLPIILADACLVLVVIEALERRGFRRGLVISAASLVAFGPTFVVLSGYHGHFDSLAILPAAIAALAWERRQTPSRALACGGLIGIGAATKTMPLFALLALLPTARSWRERLLLTVAAVAVPTVVTLPFLLADQRGVTRMFFYGGLPGWGGWSLFVQPDLVRAWLFEQPITPSPATIFLLRHGAKLSFAALLLVGVLLLRRRRPPIEAACAVWLTVYAFAANFFAGYANWGLPFLLMAGRAGEATLLTALLVPITLISYVRPELPDVAVPLYQTLAVTLQLSFVVLWVRELLRLAR
ncbi:MAG: glycosyltransferase 87 family protein, partial [Candidatus Binatia bacterium]